MGVKPFDLTGREFDFLTAKRRVSKIGEPVKWECVCVCGNTRIARSSNLLRGSVKSCGCKSRKPIEERFWKFVNKTDSCWEWTGSCDRYGIILYNQRPAKAHRVSYIIHNGPIPKGKCVCHTCDNPKCVNPEHLFLGTQLQNMHDMYRKGRGRKNTDKCLTKKQVEKLRRLKRRGKTIKELASIFDVSVSTINRAASSWYK